MQVGFKKELYTEDKKNTAMCEIFDEQINTSGDQYAFS
jgi:hypothetical protein